MQAQTVKIGGKNYRMEYTINALCQLEDQAGGVALATLAVHKSNQFLRLMVWAALITHHPGLTLEEAGDLAAAYIQQAGRRGALEDLLNGLMQAAGLGPEDEEKNGETPQDVA